MVEIRCRNVLALGLLVTIELYYKYSHAESRQDAVSMNDLDLEIRANNKQQSSSSRQSCVYSF